MDNLRSRTLRLDRADEIDKCTNMSIAKCTNGFCLTYRGLSVCVFCSILSFIHSFLPSNVRWWEGAEGACGAKVEVGLPQTMQVLAVLYMLHFWPLRTAATSIHGKAMVSGKILCFKESLAAYT